MTFLTNDIENKTPFLTNVLVSSPVPNAPEMRMYEKVPTVAQKRHMSSEPLMTEPRDIRNVGRRAAESQYLFEFNQFAAKMKQIKELIE